MYENMQAQQGQAGPDMSGFTGAQGGNDDGGADGDVVDGDFREV